jgi:hypothetical protein
MTYFGPLADVGPLQWDNDDDDRVQCCLVDDYGTIFAEVVRQGMQPNGGGPKFHISGPIVPKEGERDFSTLEDAKRAIMECGRPRLWHQ